MSVVSCSSGWASKSTPSVNSCSISSSLDAELAQDLGGVLAQPRRGAADVEVQVRRTWSAGRWSHRADDRVLDVDDHVAGEHVRVVERLVVGEHRAAGNACLVEISIHSSVVRSW